ncbi:GNAT family N-acetyltransferase [Geobacillus sp. 44B]|nr:hypothetical protein BSK33_13450 [Geobacillus sp. 44B]QNU39476.1 GNAT family N-acetyltransferase [Geobacillus sp. 44B]
MLRKFTLDDAQDVFNYASEPDASRFVPWEAHQSIEGSYNFINYILMQKDKTHMLFVWRYVWVYRVQKKSFGWIKIPMING